jgi:7,8-dihydropterin-6-yl-methyl-4-(beta-D-ribofuranosyl)aminobenzene 5'-phosphate synthase
MQIKITTLSENTANNGNILGEWGLSILIEADDKKILMDTGRSISAVHNAGSRGIDLKEIDCIVLSHGHHDHTGGLRDVLRIKGEVDVYAHPDIFSAKYSGRNYESARYCGIPYLREELESLGARFKFSKKPIKISEHVMITGEVPMNSGYEVIDSNLFVKKAGALAPDPLADDQALIIDADFGLVVILGCAHRGIVNTVRHAQTLTGKENIYAVIGGTHLFAASAERLEQTIAELQTIGIRRLGVSHCTGFGPSVRLAQEFGEAFFLNNAGTSLALP